MTSQLVQPAQGRPLDTDELWRQLMQSVGLLMGQADWGAPVSLTSFDDDSTFNTTIENQGVGGHLNVGSGLLQVTNATVIIPTLTVTTLTVATANVTTLNVSGVASLNGAVNLGDASSDAITVNGTPTFLAASTFKANVTIENSALTELAFFDVTAGAQKIRLGASPSAGLYIDIPTGITLIGTDSTPTGTNAKAWVVGGRLYAAAGSETAALGLRYVSTDGSVFLGASHSATPDLVIADNSGLQLLRAKTGGGLIVGNGTAMIGSETIRVQGQSRLEGPTTISTGGLTVTAGGLTVTAGGILVSTDNIDVQAGVAGQLRVGAAIINAASLSGSEALRVNGIALLEGDIDWTGGTWTGFTPTLAQGVAVTVTVTRARYRILGKSVVVQVVLTATSAGTGGSSVEITIPSAIQSAATGLFLAGTFAVFDASAGTYYNGGPVAASATGIRGIASGGTGALGASVFTAALANTDIIYFAAAYEIA